MMHVITGGSGSGKSAYAEMWLTGKPEKSEEKKAICPYLYIATMRPFGAETQKKIERHRQMRAGKGFQTLECYGDLRTLDDSIQRWKRSKSILDINKTCRNEKNQENAKTGGILLECVSNLLADVLYQEDGKDATVLVMQPSSFASSTSRLGRVARCFTAATSRVSVPSTPPVIFRLSSLFFSM